MVGAMTTPLPPAYFLPDGDDFVPTSMAKGPWGASVSGTYVGGLLAYVVERDHGDDELQPARLTVDLLRPVAMAPIAVRSSIVRKGKRLNLVQAELVQQGAVVAQASALLLRRGDEPPGTVWGGEVSMPPLPPEPAEVPDTVTMMIWTYGRSGAADGLSFDLTEWGHDGPKFIWVRDIRALLPGLPTTPLVRAAMAGDVASSLTHYGTDGLHYINADYTVTLSRLPIGPDIGLAAVTHSSAAGVGTGSAALFDATGLIGTATATTLANPGFAPRVRA